MSIKRRRQEVNMMLFLQLYADLFVSAAIFGLAAHITLYHYVVQYIYFLELMDLKTNVLSMKTFIQTTKCAIFVVKLILIYPSPCIQ